LHDDTVIHYPKNELQEQSWKESPLHARRF
jgi:hypothetical protein